MSILFTPLFYINGNPHIGHYYTIFVTKFVYRYFAAIGKNLHVFTGTDEHGEKIYQSYLSFLLNNPDKKKMTLEEYRNQQRELFAPVFRTLDSSYTYATATPMHIDYVKYVFKELLAKGLIYKGEYKGKYNLRTEQYIDEREYEESSDSDKACFIEERSESGYYFKIDPAVSKKIIDNIDSIIVNKKMHKQVINMLNDQKDIFITRKVESVEHSITYTNEEGEKFLIYVWFDAILNYINMSRIYNSDKNTIIIGKDILRFHSVLLMHLTYYLCDENFKFQIITHGMINLNSIKVSKSLNNTDTMSELLKEYGDVVYSYLLSLGFGDDIEISEEGVKSFEDFIKNNVRNSYKRYFALLSKYKSSALVSTWYQTTNVIIEHPDNKALIKSYKELLNADMRNINSRAVYDKLVEASNYVNKTITDNKLWEESQEKTHIYFLVGNYIRFMLLLESILCVPGASEITTRLIRENVAGGLERNMKIIDFNTQHLELLNFDRFNVVKLEKQQQNK